MYSYVYVLCTVVISVDPKKEIYIRLGAQNIYFATAAFAIVNDYQYQSFYAL